MRRKLGSLVTLAVVVGVYASPATASHSAMRVVPSRTVARSATIKEVNRAYGHDFGLKRRYLRKAERWHVSCIALTRKLYKCNWRVHVDITNNNWSGESKVRFYPLAPDVTLYNVSNDG